MRSRLNNLMAVALLLSLAACSNGFMESNSQVGFGYNKAPIEAVAPEAKRNLKGVLPRQANFKPKKSVNTTNDNPNLDQKKARDLINVYRETHGLKPVLIHPKLTIAAKAHSLDLSRRDAISHYGSDGSDPWQRVIKTGYKPILAAENVGTGQRNFEEVFKGWQESPEHKKNLLLKEATHMGIAVIFDPKTKYKTFWALLMGKPL